MGQQQLLLLVLGVVIVGLAVVVGINAFSENQIRSNADAMVTEALRMASDVQAYALKPDQFGGGGGWSNIDGTLNLSDLGIADSTVNGKYTFKASSDCDTDPAGTLFINGNADNNGDGNFGGDGDNTVCVGLDGTTAADVATEVDYGSGN